MTLFSFLTHGSFVSKGHRHNVMQMILSYPVCLPSLPACVLHRSTKASRQWPTRFGTLAYAAP
jgi:hypothetical protein